MHAELRPIPRSATRRSSEHGHESRPLAQWKDLSAYVLLAEPGGGKSEAFKREAATAGAPEGWSGTPIFIDGFDQMRADSGSRDTPLDRIVQKLRELGRPSFRICCREADWLSSDQIALRAAAPSGDVEVLYLDPLTDEEVLLLLRRRGDRVSDAQSFLDRAEQQSLDAMLRNPLLLNLLVDAVGGEDWPASREEIYERACLRMAAEHDEAIDAASRHRGAQRETAEVLDAAGWVSAVLLLSGNDVVVTGPLPSELRPGEAATTCLLGDRDSRSVEAALASKLFVADGRRREFRHRSIAEYLAARTLGRLIRERGLPLQRLLTLMHPPDGGIVEPLRGLFGWLGTHSPGLRPLLIDRDPLALVLYGDVRGYSVDDKQRLFESFRREADEFVWFRRGNWAAHPFGAMGTADMAPTLTRILASADRNPAHQAVVDCALDAIAYGEPQPSLLSELEMVVRDTSFRSDIRATALTAWLRQPNAAPSVAKAWLNECILGHIADQDKALSGRLLDWLYPRALSVSEVLSCLRLHRADSQDWMYDRFWRDGLLERTPTDQLPLLADALAALTVTPEAVRGAYFVHDLLCKIVAKALDAAGEHVPAQRMAAWLGVLIDEHGSVLASTEDAGDIRLWLERHPEVQKTLVAYEFSRLPRGTEQQRRLRLFRSERVLFEAARPRDWYGWLLEVAATADSADVAEHCLYGAARAALHVYAGYDITMEEVQAWVDHFKVRWQEAPAWLRNTWWCPLEGNEYQREHHLQQRARREERERQRAERQGPWAAMLPGIESGNAGLDHYRNLSFAYRKRYRDIEGETPEARIRDLTGGNDDDAARAIAGIGATLRRADVPSAADVLVRDRVREFRTQGDDWIETQWLLAAELATQRDAAAPLKWTDELATFLVALWLTGQHDTSVDWYDALALQRPNLVADVLRPYAEHRLRLWPEQPVQGLWKLARGDRFAALARLVIPPLLEAFPSRARAAHLDRLNGELLPAASRHLDPDEFRRLVAARLQRVEIDSGQRIAWWVSGLRFAPRMRGGELLCCVRTSRVRTRRLADALIEQFGHRLPMPDWGATAWARLFEALAPGTPSEHPFERLVGGDHRLRELVRILLSRLGSCVDEDAGAELRRLRELPVLAAWRPLVDGAAFENARLQWAHRFRHEAPKAVADALSGGAPANALDLSVYVALHLDELQQRLRGDVDNGVLQFWRDPVRGKPRLPRDENACRDLIYARMRPALERANVTLHKECAHASNTRSDLETTVNVSGSVRMVPVEIKKESHAKVWTAWSHQLDGSYTTHPAAQGVGIYLVLWFGYQPRSLGRGKPRPGSALEMEEMLRCQLLAADRQRLIVKVLDLSLPGARDTRSGRRR